MNKFDQIKEELENYIQSNIEPRIFSKSGGIKYDYINFCTDSDFDWIKEEIANNFENIYQYTFRELDFNSEREMVEYIENYEELQDIVSNSEYYINNSIREIQEDLVENRMIEHLENEINFKKVAVDKAFNTLIDNMIDKDIVFDFEELNELEEYQQIATKYNFIYVEQE